MSALGKGDYSKLTEVRKSESRDRTWPFLLYPKTFCLCTCASLNKSVPSWTQSGMVCKLLCSSDPPEGLRKPRLCLTLPGDFVSMIKVESAFRKTPDNSLFTFINVFFICLSIFLCICVYACVYHSLCVEVKGLLTKDSAFHHADPAARTQIVRLGSKCFYRLSCLIGPGSQLIQSFLTYGYI